MAYREDLGWSDVEPLKCKVTVRVNGEEITRTVTTRALDPMGQVRSIVADELGISMRDVRQVTWSVVE